MHGRGRSADAAYVASWWESSHRSPFVLSRDSVIPAIGRIQSLGADCKLEDLKFHPPSARIQNQLMENISNRTFGEMKDGCMSHEDWASLQASRQLSNVAIPDCLLKLLPYPWLANTVSSQGRGRSTYIDQTCSMVASNFSIY